MIQALFLDWLVIEKYPQDPQEKVFGSHPSCVTNICQKSFMLCTSERNKIKQFPSKLDVILPNVQTLFLLISKLYPG